MFESRRQAGAKVRRWLDPHCSTTALSGTATVLPITEIQYRIVFVHAHYFANVLWLG